MPNNHYDIIVIGASIVGATAAVVSTGDYGLVEHVAEPGSARGDVLLFLAQGLQPRGEDWLEVLVAQAVRPEIGAAGARGVHIPLGCEPGVQQTQIERPVFVQQRPVHEPFHQLIAVWGGQDFIERIVVAEPRLPESNRQ